MHPDSAEAGRAASLAVVVMSYRRPDTIGAAIDSLIAQPSLGADVDAVYLADDCSTDDTVEVARRHWSSSLPLQLLQPPKNAGTWGNVNQAIARLAAKHDWVLLLHDDDMVKPNWLTEMRRAILAAPPSVGSVCSSWDVLQPTGAIETGEDNRQRTDELIDGSPAAVRRTLQVGCWWHFSGCAIRTKAFTDIGPFDPAFKQCGDEEWLLRGLAKGWGVTYIPLTLLLYRAHPGSLSTRSFVVHQDVIEQLWLVRRFGRSLAFPETVRLHGRLLAFLLRRMASAVLNLRWATGAHAIALTPRVFGSLIATTAGRGGNEPGVAS